MLGEVHKGSDSREDNKSSKFTNHILSTSHEPLTSPTPRRAFRRQTLPCTPTFALVNEEYAISGTFQSVTRTATLTNKFQPSVGIIASTWPMWIFSLSHAIFRLDWVLLGDAKFKSLLKRKFPSVTFLLSSSVDWSVLAPVDIVAVNGKVVGGIRPLPFGSVMLFDWNCRTSSSAWTDWVGFVYPLSHAAVGGVTDYFGKFKIAVHKSSKPAFSVDPSEFPTYPLSDLGSVLECKATGVEVTGTRLARLHTPVVKWVDHGALHHRGLFPWDQPNAKVLAPCVFFRKGMVIRQLTTLEQLAIRDVPVSFVRLLSPREQGALWRCFPVPAKCLQEVVIRLFHIHPVTMVGFGGGLLPVSPSADTALVGPSRAFPQASPASANSELAPSTAAFADDAGNAVDASTATSTDAVNGVDALSSPTTCDLPGGWVHNRSKDAKISEAAKHDDASVPVEFWHKHLCLKLGLETLSAEQEAALEVIRNWVIHRYWKKSVLRCFCNWMRCSQCSEKHFGDLFGSTSLYPIASEYSLECIKCKEYWKRTKEFSELSYVPPIGNAKAGLYVWTEGGRAKYKTWYESFFRLNEGSREEREDRRKSLEGGLDCLKRTRDCSVWKWDGGSRLFFWRWGEFLKSVRDGADIFVRGTLPQCKEKQRVPKDPEILRKVQEKLSDVRNKGYIDKGNVSSVTSFFEVPKGDSDIRMVYNGTSSGLNDAVWAPWFSLPTVESHLRAVTNDTFMCDCDLSEMFLNFLLPELIREFAGVDFTNLFPDEVKDKTKKLWERWTRMLMGFKPSPYCTTRDVKRIEEFLKGSKDNPRNPFRWYKVVLNLPGMKKYDPSLPWVFKIRTDGKMAGDLFIYIDDLRVAASNEVDAWEGAHQVCCRLSWLGLQDAPRKRRAASRTPGAWAGSVIHTEGDLVCVLVSDKKWLKTKKWIKWLKDNVDNEKGMDFRMLESCRGYLIYVSRTYLPMKPYLRGLHKTIDSWRPGRDVDGWKLVQELYDINKEDDSSMERNITRDDVSHVKPVPRLKHDIDVLERLTKAEAPPKVIRRRKKRGTVAYGFGDASGKGFGHAICIQGQTRLEFGQWSATIEEKHSNYKELRNLVNAVKSAYEAGALEGVELFLFTDNFVSECAYYNGGSNHSRDLDEVIFDLWQIQMAGTFTLHVYHVAGTRMIECGVDGLSRGDKTEGIAGGMDIYDFIPIHLSPRERSSGISAWIESWWKVEEFGELELLSPEGWFDKSMQVGSFLWDVPPAAGDAAVEQLCGHIHGRPENTHIFLIPRLCTSRWRKQLSKAMDIVLTVDACYDFWGRNMHEPLMLGIYLPLLAPLHKFRPWKFKHTDLVEKFGKQVHRMQAARESMDWDILYKFLSQTRKIPSMPDELARELLQEKKPG